MTPSPDNLKPGMFALDAYVGEDFILLPNVEEQTVLVSYVRAGELIIDQFPLEQYAQPSSRMNIWLRQLRNVYSRLYGSFGPMLTADEDDEASSEDVEEEIVSGSSQAHRVFNAPDEALEDGVFCKCKKREPDYSIIDNSEETAMSEKLHLLHRLSKELREMGASQDLINLMVEPEQHVCRLEISEDLRVLVPEKGGELRLTPLQRALYLLFLRHPEGIPFKCLSDYREELTQLYLKMSTRNQEELIAKSIDDLVDSTTNSANEKCSRIQQAFVRLFGKAEAQTYIIQGKRGEPKKVAINRDLVQWKTE